MVILQALNSNIAIPIGALQRYCHVTFMKISIGSGEYKINKYSFCTVLHYVTVSNYFIFKKKESSIICPLV